MLTILDLAIDSIPISLSIYRVASTMSFQFPSNKLYNITKLTDLSTALFPTKVKLRSRRVCGKCTIEHNRHNRHNKIFYLPSLDILL